MAYATVIRKEYFVDNDGNITSKDFPIDITSNNPGDPVERQRARIESQSQASFNEAIQKSNDLKTKKLQDTYEKKLAETTSQENAKNALAQQIAALAGSVKPTAGSAQSSSGIGDASNLMYAGGSQNFNEAIGAYNATNTNQSMAQPNRLSPVNFISMAEASEINALAQEATKKENGTSRVNAISPSTEVPPKGAIQYSISGGLGPDAKQTLNPDYDPEVAKKWQEKQRTYRYDRLSKYIGEDAANKLKTKYDQIYSVSNLQADPNIRNKLNFQVSDDQILNDYNASRISKITQINQDAQTQKVGILNRLQTAEKLLAELPESDARYKSSKVYVDQLNSDLASVNSAITDSFSQIKSFKPIELGSSDAANQITSFREYLQLPEERATQQLRQIDPKSYETAVALGQRYRQMATAPIEETKSAQTEQLRSNLEQEAINQLALGSQLGAEEQRQYQQAARAAQTARGNIFGVAPAVEEAVTTGAAGEQRKLARYGAATQFLASGQNTSDALKADLAFRDALLQSRLGAASGFVAGGPSLYNLGQARTGAQQSAFQNYVQANQALPGQFGQAPSTAQPFYQAVDQGIPVNLTNTFANLYGSQANYLANTYGAQVGAISRSYTSPSQAFGNVASGLGSLFSFSKAF